MCIKNVYFTFFLAALITACDTSSVSNSALETKSPIMPLYEFSQKIKITTPLKEMKRGEIVRAGVTIRNTSSEVWPSKGGSPVHLSYHWLDKAGNVVVFDGERTALPMDIEAGGSANVRALIKAPERPGNYILRMTMVQEFVAWFDHRGAKVLNVPVVIK